VERTCAGRKALWSLYAKHTSFVRYLISRSLLLSVRGLSLELAGLSLVRLSSGGLVVKTWQFSGLFGFAAPRELSRFQTPSASWRWQTLNVEQLAVVRIRSGSRAHGRFASWIVRQSPVAMASSRPLSALLCRCRGRCQRHGRRDSSSVQISKKKSPSKRLRRLEVGPRRASRAVVHDRQALGQWLRVLWRAQTTDGAEALCAL